MMGRKILCLLSLLSISSARNIFIREKSATEYTEARQATNTTLVDKYHPILIEGDIAAEWDSISRAYGSQYAEQIGLEPSKDRATSPLEILWDNDFRPGNEVYRVKVYTRKEDFTTEQYQYIKTSLKRFQSKTSVFKIQTLSSRPGPGVDYLEIFSGDGCWSYIGRVFSGEAQPISINNEGCVWESTIHHELMHALGIYHEQSRPDRDSYVSIIWENIMEGFEGNFEKVLSVDSLGSPYDYDSVMHYHNWAFSKNGEQTINSFGNAIDPDDYMSTLDVQQIRLMYQCSSGPRHLNQHQANKCNNSDCKCGKKQKGCGSDDNKCKGSLFCVNDRCKKKKPGPPTPSPPTPSPTSCVDSPENWHDIDGPEYNCAWYAQGNNCNDYGDLFENFGSTANEACCVCGGGIGA